MEAISVAIHVRVAGKLKWLHLRFQNHIHHSDCTKFGCQKKHRHLWLTNITRKAMGATSPRHKSISAKNKRSGKKLQNLDRSEYDVIYTFNTLST